MQKAKSFISSQCALGEGPIWDDQRQQIFWVDILGKAVHRADENGQNHTMFSTPDCVSNIFLTEDGEDLILCLPDAFYLWNPENGQLKKWVEMPEYDPETRTNDGLCDVHGNLWIGTMAMSEKPDLGKLYMLDNELNWHAMLDHTSISNGLRCLPNGETYYYIDTPTQLIREFAFDPEASTWDFVRNVFWISAAEGHPDGMSMDADGRLWVSLWNGYGVVCVDPKSGEIVDRIDVPAPQVSANIFGGKDGNKLFITTARKQLDEDVLSAYPETGDLFRVSLKVKGGVTYRRKV